MSHCDSILDVLASGRWVSTSEILRAVPCVVHSRVSDLRRRGYDIQHRTTGIGAKGSEYRLVVPAASVALANEITALIAEGILEPAGELAGARCGGAPASSSTGGLSEEENPARHTATGRTAGLRVSDPSADSRGNSSSESSLAPAVGTAESGRREPIPAGSFPLTESRKPVSTVAANEPEQLPLEAA